MQTHLTKRSSEPLTRHGESSTGFDFMKQFQQIATVYPPRRVSGRSAWSRWAAELAEVDPHGRFVRWLANKQTVED